MRDDTVTKRKPNSTTKNDATRFSKPDVLRPGDRVEGQHQPHRHDDGERAEHHPLHLDVAIEPSGSGLGAGLLRAHVLDAALERIDDRRHRLHQRDQAGHGDGARAHRADVVLPHLSGRHVADRDRARIERIGEPFAEELDRRHQHQPGEHAAGEDRSGDLRADDVADAEILAGDFRAERRARQPCRLVERALLPHLRGGHQERVGAAESEAPEHAAGERAALFSRDQHVGAGRPFRIQQVAVFLDDELPAQRNHEQHADPPADERQQEDARVFERKAHEDQRRQREDGAGGDRLAGRPGGLHDVVLEDRRLAEGAQEADAQDRDGDGGGDRQAGAQADIDRDGAEDDPEDRAEEHGLERELRLIGPSRDCTAETRREARSNSSWDSFASAFDAFATHHLRQRCPVRSGR